MNRMKKVQTERTKWPKSEHLKSKHKLVQFGKLNIRISALYCRALGQLIFKSITRLSFIIQNHQRNHHQCYKMAKTKELFFTCVGCSPTPSPALMTGFSHLEAQVATAPGRGWRKTTQSEYLENCFKRSNNYQLCMYVQMQDNLTDSTQKCLDTN